jgi:hypothetical protein
VHVNEFYLEFEQYLSAETKVLTNHNDTTILLSRRRNIGATLTLRRHPLCSAACPRSQIGRKMPSARISTSTPRKVIMIGSIWLDSVLSS